MLVANVLTLACERSRGMIVSYRHTLVPVTCPITDLIVLDQTWPWYGMFEMLIIISIPNDISNLTLIKIVVVRKC